MKTRKTRTSAADRTNSWRMRAGTRRNKRLRNVGTHAGDFPKSWTRFYHCDGSFSHAQELIPHA